MAYDQGLAQRVAEYFDTRVDDADVQTKKMFGGLCFMVANHMCCGIVGEMLMLRVSPDNYQKYLGEKYVREMDFTGRPMKGMVYVLPEGLEDDSQLARWIEIGETFVKSLPPKNPKASRNTKEKRKKSASIVE